MRTKIYTYKGQLGIESSPDAEGLLNDPMKKGQLGFVLDADYVDISPDALEFLKKVQKSHDAIGDVDVWNCQDGKTCIGWLGGPMQCVGDPRDISGSKNYDTSKLIANESVKPSASFIEYIDSKTKNET